MVGLHGVHGPAWLGALSGALEPLAQPGRLGMEDFQQNVALPWLKGGVDLEPGPCSATHLAVGGQVQHPWEAIKHILTQCSPTSSRHATSARHAWKALGASSRETQTLFSCSVPPTAGQ